MKSVSSQALEVLNSVFGYESFRPSQSEIIDRIVDGNDVFVLMPTGGGKSLCYQVPALVRDGLAIIVSPLISLMHDQVRELKAKGVAAAFVASDQAESEKREIYNSIKSGELKMLYVSPERLHVPKFINFLKKTKLSLFAIDEAHCVSQWGHDFRPSYKNIGQVLRQFPDVPKVALTATADKPTQKDVVQLLGIEKARFFVSGFDRKNIELNIEKREGNAFDALMPFLKKHAGKTGIIYRTSKRKVDDTVLELLSRGMNVIGYHAGMTKRDRLRAQERFDKEDDIVVVATVAFGMGIDKPNVRFVAHMDPPSSMEAYYQEIGRAGRDGEESVALLQYSDQQMGKVRQRIEMNDDIDDERKSVLRAKAEGIAAFLETPTCRRATLLRYFGEDPKEECGKCDRCLQRPRTREGKDSLTTIANAVLQTGSKYGIKTMISIISPDAHADLRMDSEHRGLDCYGTGRSLSPLVWRKVIRQLIGSGHLELAVDRFGALQVTRKGREVLFGKEASVPLVGDWVEIAPKIVVEDHKGLSAGQRDRLPEAWVDMFDRLREEFSVDIDMEKVSEKDLVRVIEGRPSNAQEMSDITDNETLLSNSQKVIELLSVQKRQALSFNISL